MSVVVSTVLSFVSVFIAGVALARTIADRIPTVFLFCSVGEYGEESDFYLEVHNPSRRVIILERIEPIEFTEDVAFSSIDATLNGTIRRAIHDVERYGESKSNTAIFAAVPPGQKRLVKVTFSNTPYDDQNLSLLANIYWSKTCPWILRCIYPWKINYTNEDLIALANSADIYSGGKPT